MHRPKNCISVEEAKDLEYRWQETRGELLEKGLGYVDTHQTIFTIKELRNYLDYVERESVLQEIEAPKIAIFLGAYKKTEERPSLTTVFLAPTKSVASGLNLSDEINYDIDPLNNGVEPWPPGKYANE
ncbi:hypothetical protein [Zunongwangia atlantica]|uniref:Uncharacterized protein n=1 Tax=Zunongwangia atlantica 22II14-10F7 TaxID=1185767 RepID=A0A1Y1T8R4_9FLAO|nr:hypothetical protein [Zunongwangia atlantica]ORL46954.1 hypothetical protein IIF7_03011 [Zunongwangia atlantica 22II14-10F7]